MADVTTVLLAGTGRAVRRDRDVQARPRDPAALVARAVRVALDDAGLDVRALEGSLVAVVEVVTRAYRDPGRAVLAHLRADVQARTVVSSTGGASPAVLLAEAVRALRAGEHDVAVVCGGETLASLVRAQRAGVEVPLRGDGDVRAAPVLGSRGPGADDAEVSLGLLAPATTYSLVEDALRRHHGRTHDEQEAVSAALWSRLSRVAAEDPLAWDRTARTPAQLRSGDDGNRRVTRHHRKLLVANSNVDQAAAVVLVADRAGARVGIDVGRSPLLASVATGRDVARVSRRARLDRSAALRLTVRAALDDADLELDDVEHLDLYACFPSAVQVACAELGLPLDDPARPLSLAGGLTSGGGPANAAALWALARAVEVVRAEAGPPRRAPAPALVSAVSWFLTGHGAVVVLPPGADRPARARTDVVDPDRLATVRRRVVADVQAGVEAATEVLRRDGSVDHAVACGRAADGSRWWARTEARA